MVICVEEISDCGCNFHHPEKNKNMMAIGGPNGLMKSDIPAPKNYRDLSYEEFIQWVKDNMRGRTLKGTDLFGVSYESDVMDITEEGIIIMGPARRS